MTEEMPRTDRGANVASDKPRIPDFGGEKRFPQAQCEFAAYVMEIENPVDAFSSALIDR